MAWQSTYSSVVTITSSHCPHLREAHLRASHTGIPCASTNCTSPIHSATHTSASPIYAVPHTGVNLPGGPSHSFMGTPPMTSRQAIPLLTPFVAKGERGHPTRT